jgi:hypothetical protein
MQFLRYVFATGGEEKVNTGRNLLHNQILVLKNGALQQVA